MFESDSDDSCDSEECRSWTSNATEGKSCEFEKEEGMELDARKA